MALALNALNIVAFAFCFNRIKGVSDKLAYPVTLFAYISSMIMTNFSYLNMIYAYILFAFIFAFTYAAVRGWKFNLLNAFLMLNIVLFLSIVTAAPIPFVGYGEAYILINIILIVAVMTASTQKWVRKSYYAIYTCWNRKVGNRFRSVSVRNATLISIYFAISGINIFINYVFIASYVAL